VLRLYVTDDSPSGGRVSSTTSAWDESTVTWATQPAIGTAVGELGEAVIGQWTVIDVTSIVVGNGTYSFHIGGVSGNSVLYSSREGATPPQLVISGAGTPPPPPAAPVASFSATPTSGTAPLAVTFTDTSTGTPTSWAWDFDNDGTTDSTAQNPTHTYSSAGTYSVRLTVGNAGGSDTLTRTGLISATTPPPPPAAPVASFSATPTSGTAPLAVIFTDTSTCTPTSWALDFDNDGTTDSTAQNPTHTYSSAGTYSVRLTVGNAGGSDTLTRTDLISATTPPPPDPGAAVLVGAGDIAKCTSTVDEATAALVEAIPGAVFTAGDNVYENGTATEFANCYDPSWGRFKSRTRPTVGNHEYGTAGASGYFGYFGAAAGEAGKGYYSYDVGSWHIVALNSECSIVSCAAGSVQEQWLRADLAAHPTACTMAIFHRPLFSSASTSGATAVRPLWQALYDANAELIVNGHAHVYERYAPQRPDGTLDLQRGIRQFTIGTGGVAHAGAGTLKPNNEVFENVSYGVMKFTLRAGGYDWQFIPIPGDTLNDAGSGTCH
jgi:PKD repeat protein